MGKEYDELMQAVEEGDALLESLKRPGLSQDKSGPFNPDLTELEALKIIRKVAKAEKSNSKKNHKDCHDDA